MTKSNTTEKISNLLNLFAQKSPQKMFLHELQRDSSLTYKEFNNKVNATCRLFKELGLQRGDLIASHMENNLEFCLLFFASIRYGTIFFPYPSNLIAAEFSKELEILKPDVLFIQQNKEEDDRRIDHPLKIVISSRTQNSCIGDLSSYGSRYQEEPSNPEEPALLFQSSGTEFHPKGIYYTHKNIMSLIPSICRSFGFYQGDTHLIVLPLSHSAPVNYSLLPALYSGSSVILADSFWEIKDSFWEICRTFGITYVEVVPTILFMLLNLPNRSGGVRSLKYIGCGSAPLSLKLQDDFEKEFIKPVANLYGLTETGPTHVDNPLSPGWKRGTIGRALDVNQVDIVDEKGILLPDGQEGEMIVKGDNVFPGYAINPEKSGHYFKNGYFYTGDIGYRSSDGIYSFSRRKKDLIIRGGLNIHPEEINQILATHPAVNRVRTRGEPNDFFGEEIRSDVVIQKNMRTTENDLLAYCKSRLSPIKVPDRIQILTD
jgi:long-chain acyl-CoA synthetase